MGDSVNLWKCKPIKGVIKMATKVRFCPCNFEDEMEVVKQHLMDSYDLEIIEERCLLYCGQCLVTPFALVEGENITASNPEELLKKIAEFLNQKEMKV
jgi:uncharacterized protein YuzB (UPF0349 family)